MKVLLARLEVRSTAWWTWLIPSVTAHQGYDLLAQQQRAAVALSLDLSKLLGKGAQEAERAGSVSPRASKRSRRPERGHRRGDEGGLLP